MILANSILFLIITVSFQNVNSVDIECVYKYDEFYSISSQYTCVVENSLTITNKNTKIDSIIGYSRATYDVKGLSIQNKEVEYMPVNLAQHFAELIAMRIKESDLKEIHQSDLKPFSLLRYLNLDSNRIETLEDGLFAFNPNLELIWMEQNKISNVGLTTFSNLNKLKDLDLNKNLCISRRSTHIYGIPDLLDSVKRSCNSVLATTTTTTSTSTTTMATTTTSTMLRSDEIPERPKSNNFVWIIVCIAVVCVLAFINFIVIKKCFRERTVIIKPIEPEDC